MQEPLSSSPSLSPISKLKPPQHCPFLLEALDRCFLMPFCCLQVTWHPHWHFTQVTPESPSTGWCYSSFSPLHASSSSLPKHLWERKGGIKNIGTCCGRSSVRLGQSSPGFSISWYAPTAHSDISPAGKAFAFPLKSYITWQSTLIKNVDSGFSAGSLQGFKREYFTALYILSDNTWQVSWGSEYFSQLKHWLEDCHLQTQVSSNQSPPGWETQKRGANVRFAASTWLCVFCVCVSLMTERQVITVMEYCIHNISSRSAQSWLHQPADDGLFACSLCLETLIDLFSCEFV